MTTITVTSYLPAPPARVWDEVNKPRLLFFVARPMVRFAPVAPKALPDRWEETDYLFSLKWHGIIPLGRQVISLSRPAPKDGTHFLRDNGHSRVAKRWDHLISIAPEGGGTRYTDSVTVDAGLLTPVVAAFARRFYAHRQARWKTLVAHDFNYPEGGEPAG